MHERHDSLRRSLGELTPLETPSDVIRGLRQLASGGVLDLPLPGKGDTAARFRALAEIGAVDLSLARLAEGHTDAQAILAEAARAARPGLYGVWAAEPAEARVVAERTPDGFRLRGQKRFASGAHGLDRALVTAQASDGGRLFDVDLRHASVRPVDGTWQAVGMAATESVDVIFDGVDVGEDAAVGEPGFYLARPGFWWGAIGVAACWYGGALGAFRLLRRRLAAAASAPGGAVNDHQLAHLGAIAAACEAMRTVLDDAAAHVDAEGASRGRDKDSSHGEARRRRALVARHVVEQACQEVLARVGRAGGTSPLVFDRAHARRAADLVVYLRQHHAEKDLESLGRAVLAEARSDLDR